MSRPMNGTVRPFVPTPTSDMQQTLMEPPTKEIVQELCGAPVALTACNKLSPIFLIISKEMYQLDANNFTMILFS